MSGRAQFVQDRQALQRLQRRGVPVFTCLPARGPGKEFAFPRGWPSTSASDYDLSGAEPGCAFCLLTGHGVDVIDVDPRNDGDLDLVRATLLDCESPIVASVATPGGGAHFYIPSTGLRALRMPPGVDYLAGRHMAFAPPSQRPKYPGHQYRWIAPPDPGLVGIESPNARAAVLALAAAQGSDPLHPAASNSRLIVEIRDLETGAAFVRMAPRGSRNKTLYEVAATLAGRGFDELLVVDALVPAAVSGGLSTREARQSAQSGVRRGLTRRSIAVRWGYHVRGVIPPQRLRTASRRDTVDVLVEVFSLFGWQEAGIGCRDLAERINCSAETASRRLRELRLAGLLQRHPRDIVGFGTDVYAIPKGLVRHVLTQPVLAGDEALASVDTQIQVPSTSSPAPPGECQRLPTLGGRGRAIRGHSAFSRMGRGVALPPQASLTLLAIEQGASTVLEIQRLSEMSADAIRDHLRILESAGLIKRNSTHPMIRIEPIWNGDLLPALDQWCEQMGIGDRPTLRQEYHALQRQRFRAVRNC